MRGKHAEPPYNAGAPPMDSPPSYSETLMTAPQPPQMVQQVVQVVQQLPAPDFGPHPVKTVCSSCQQSITTSTKSKASAMAWGLSLVLCFTFLWPCFCVPFCVDSMKDVKHYCPACNVVLGRYRGGRCGS